MSGFFQRYTVDIKRVDDGQFPYEATIIERVLVDNASRMYHVLSMIIDELRENNGVLESGELFVEAESLVKRMAEKVLEGLE